MGPWVLFLFRSVTYIQQIPEGKKKREREFVGNTRPSEAAEVEMGRIQNEMMWETGLSLSAT